MPAGNGFAIGLPRTRRDGCGANEFSESNGRRVQNTGSDFGMGLRDRVQTWPTATGGDSWPTPDTGESLTGHGMRGGYSPNGHQSSLDLKATAATWATPHTNCTTGSGTQGRDGGENLQTQIGHWQTPNLSRQVYRLSPPDPPIPDGPSSSESVQTSRPLWGTPNAHERTFDAREVDHGVQLANQVATWPTPRAEERCQYNSRDNYEALSLTVQHWPTPMERDHWMTNNPRQDGRQNQLPNIAAVFHNSLPDPQIPDGPPSSENVQTSRPLWETPGTRSG